MLKIPKPIRIYARGPSHSSIDVRNKLNGCAIGSRGSREKSSSNHVRFQVVLSSRITCDVQIHVVCKFM
jgi:hypothetical protein